MQSTIRSRPASAAIRLSTQSATCKLQHRAKHSNRELRGPTSRLKVGPRISRSVRSAPLLAQTPNPPTK
eukprot:863969-Alexandrium_andersonii.AAC.1